MRLADSEIIRVQDLPKGAFVILRGTGQRKGMGLIYIRECVLVDPSSPAPVPTRTIRPSSTPTPIPTTEAGATQRARYNARATERARGTPTPDSSNEQAYRREIAAAIVGDGSGWDVATALATLGDAFTQAGENPILILNYQWRIEVAVGVVALTQSYQNVRKLNPPDELEGFHNYVVEGLWYCDHAAGLITRAVDDMDDDALQDAVEYIELCGAMIQQALADPNW